MRYDCSLRKAVVWYWSGPFLFFATVRYCTSVSLNFHHRPGLSISYKEWTKQGTGKQRNVETTKQNCHQHWWNSKNKIDNTLTRLSPSTLISIYPFGNFPRHQTALEVEGSFRQSLCLAGSSYSFKWKSWDKIAGMVKLQIWCNFWISSIGFELWTMVLRLTPSRKPFRDEGRLNRRRFSTETETSLNALKFTIGKF